MVKSSPKGQKTPITCNFTFSHGVFKRLIFLQTRRIQGLSGKGFYTLPYNKVYPIPKQQVLDSSKFKAFADDHFKFDENGGKFSRIQNAVGKEEIAHYVQFLLFPQSFQKT